jgi:hypothetical protein
VLSLQKNQNMGYILQNFKVFDLWKMEQNDLVDFTKFVLRIYYEHHLNVPAPIDEVEMCIKEDELLYPHTHFYALKTKEGNFFGAINACLWDGIEELAIEREYNLNLKQLIKARGLNPSEIWHVGRFAIDRKLINQNQILRKSQGFYFKLLMTYAFAHVCTHSDNLMIAECDKKLQGTLVKLGIVSEELSKGHFVLGSEALPILNTGAGLRPFVEKHKHLLNYVL